MATKIQKIFAKFIRTKNPNERKAFGRKLKGVKDSEVSYTKDGQRYTIHGNIPWKKPSDSKHKKPSDSKPKKEAPKKETQRRRWRRRAPTQNQQRTNYDNYGTQPSSPGFRHIKKNAPKPTKRKYSDDPYWDGYAKTKTGK